MYPLLSPWNGAFFQLLNDKIIEQLKKGTVPWRKQWIHGGVPTNFLTRNPFRGINVMLLAMLGYERNFFITENQLAEIDGSIKPKEKPHMAVSWNNFKK